MRVIAISDSHGSRANVNDALVMAQQRGKIDACVFLGDGLRDYEDAKPILRAENLDILLYAVRGNCDLGAFDAPLTEVFTLAGCRFFATHGHAYGAKHGMERLFFAAREEQAKVCLFGHTHYPMLERQHDVLFLNPGSVAERRAGRPAYAEIKVDQYGEPHGDLINWLE
ncbi:MAG: YfcE family phosphodiesterase [Eubacteriales bacterium]|nr:YfcE family phosphodiesterase [Eubacteriales bacterium]